MNPGLRVGLLPLLSIRLARAALLVVPALFMSCDNPQSARGFSLPQGDPERGQATFIELQCHSCHEVAGLELPPPLGRAAFTVVLGGETPRVKTYGELVTSIINPSHRLAEGYPRELVSVAGQSKMTVYNEVLTVSQLVDLVAFLEAHYELQPYERTDYPMLP